MKKNFILITSSIIGIFIITWLCVKFMDHDKYYEPTEDKQSVVEDNNKNIENNNSRSKEEKIKLNGLTHNIIFKSELVKNKETDEDTQEEYYEDNVEYNILFDNQKVENIYIMSFLEDKDLLDKMLDINEKMYTIKGKDDKDYLVIKIVTSDYSYINENIYVINDTGKVLYNYSHDISSVFYKLVGLNSEKYIIGSNNCKDFSYIIGGENLCKEYDKLYTLYKINNDSINLLTCSKEEEDNFELNEQVLVVDNSKVKLTSTENTYKINSANLSGSGFFCPIYNNYSK